MCPETSGPCVGVEGAHSEDAPLLRLPCRVEPKGLGKHAEDACPSAPSCTLILCKPYGDDAAESNTDLIEAHELLVCCRNVGGTEQRQPTYCPLSLECRDFAWWSAKMALYGWALVSHNFHELPFFHVPECRVERSI